MKKQFNKGLLLTSLGSFWWGFIGVIYFEYVSFIGHTELVVHRCIMDYSNVNYDNYFFFKMENF